MKFTYLSALIFLPLPGVSSGASFNIGATTELSFTNRDGDNLATGSIVQVGYFETLSTQNPLTYDETIWESFTAILGVASLNPGKDSSSVNIQDFGVDFPANFDFLIAFDTETDELSDAVGKRLGIRVFDNVNINATAIELLSSNFNTVSSSNNSWVLPGESGGSILSPNLYIADDPANTATLGWQFGPASAFMTTIPEPSTSLTLLLGAGLLLGSRRR